MGENHLKRQKNKMLGGKINLNIYIFVCDFRLVNQVL